MPYDTEFLAALAEREEETGPRRIPAVKPGFYLAKFSEEGSEVAEINGSPAIKPAVVILAGKNEEEISRTVTSTLWWFASENANYPGAKSYEKRQETTRARTAQQIRGVVHQIGGNQEADDDIGREIEEVLASLYTDDKSEVTSGMEALLMLFDGIQVVVKVTNTKDKTDKDLKFSDYRVFVDESNKPESYANSFETGMKNVGVVSDEDISNL